MYGIGSNFLCEVQLQLCVRMPKIFYQLPLAAEIWPKKSSKNGDFSTLFFIISIFAYKFLFLSVKVQIKSGNEIADG